LPLELLTDHAKQQMYFIAINREPRRKMMALHSRCHAYNFEAIFATLAIK
jgi:hypothetical protein